ncbi:fibronectin type III domain-containing protein [Krasilnikovia sp. MM14-A1259]|uniref:fibronectin type III domain-containing protein n=1 Tax=Krasilnikovia sp. MM14-A1259 TaxID=3373539 RepID=UPI0037F880EC
MKRALRRVVPAALVLTLASGAAATAFTRAGDLSGSDVNGVDVPVGAASTHDAVFTAAHDGDAGATQSDATQTTRVLPQAMHGQAAVRTLGDRLPMVAAVNGRSVTALKKLLTEDPTMWVSQSGRIFVKDTLPADDTAAMSTPGHLTASASQPLAQTFTLHSLPGSRRTIYLDFDGADATSLAWNSQAGLAAGTQPGWDPAQDGPGFSDAEKASIQEIWASVAEDYAPFDVDVTTQDPGDAALIKSSSGDLDYGTRLVVTDSDSAWASLCHRSCGGIAWLGTFGAQETGQYQVAWVFSRGASNLAHPLSEAAAHEIGHTFNLTHDGTATQGDGSYYGGHTGWAPIMGVSYYHAVTQWSKGEYADANNQQDDVAAIASRAPFRPDEAGDTRATAAHVPAGTAYITNRDDVDYYALGQCTGPVTVTANPAAVGADLDINLKIVDATGSPVATADPASAESNAIEPYPFDTNQGVTLPHAAGMDAAVSVTLPNGRYYAIVDGGGAQEGGSGNPVTDYDDYGSIGAYTLTATGCTADATIPGAPTNLTATISGTDGLAVTWAAPINNGGDALIGYDVTLDGAAPTRAGADVTTKAWPNLTTGVHTVTVAAVNTHGAGLPASISARRTVPAAPTFFGTHIASDQQSQNPNLLYFYIDFLPPTDDGGSTITAYRVEVEIRPGVWETITVHQVDAYAPNIIAFGHGVSFMPGHPPQGMRISWINEVGESAPLTRQAQIPGPPMLLGMDDMTITPDRLANTLRVQWHDPYHGGHPIEGTRLGFAHMPDPDNVDTDHWPVTDVQDVGPNVHDVTFINVAAGEHLLAVEAYNDLGPRRQIFSVTMPALLPPDPVAEFDPVALDARAGTATVQWKAPATDPLLPILGYDVSIDGAPAVRITTTSYKLTGLALGSTHTFTVSAVNRAGVSHPYGPPDIRVVTTPAPVTNLAATVDRTSSNNLTVNATFTSAADNGGESGDPQYWFRMQPVDGPDGYWQPTGSTSLTAQWLEPGRYTLQVRTHNANGDSSITSLPVTVRPTEVPGLVTDLRVKHLNLGAGTATVTWGAPEDDGGSPLWNYWVKVTDQTAPSGTTAPVDGLSYALTGLVTGHTYQVEVHSWNTIGDSPVAYATFVAASAPSAATSPQATTDRLARTVTATWGAPQNAGGADVRHYYVRLDAGDWLQLSGDAASYTFSHVTTGEHTVQVRAENGALDDDGNPATSIAISTATMPAAPVAPGAVVGLKSTPDAAHERAVLSWSTPASDGGTPVTGYDIVVGDKAFTTAGTTFTATGLKVGTVYRITVSARNAVGSGASSAQTVTLTTTPGAPKIGAVKAGKAGGSTTVVFTWAPPTVTGGTPLQGYEVVVYTLKKGRIIGSKAYPVAAGRLSLEVKLPAKAGVTYAAAVRVKNVVGWSPLSARSKAAAPR